MEQYLIHTCITRLWYVKRFLIPSMKEQGITDDEIKVYVDTDFEGQITSLIKSCEFTNGRDTWHLQDDIIISKNFKTLAEKKRTQTVVCGFCNSFSKSSPGYANIYNMWYSMPCIKIPDIIFQEFINWLQNPIIRKRLKPYFDENKHDDVFLETFLKENYPRMSVWNIAPNMVNHVDHLIGGSLINRDRNKEPSELMSKYWDEPELLVDIERKLKEYQIRC